jgi:hypothetical protein
LKLRCNGAPAIDARARKRAQTVATNYVVCITKHPTHRDPHTRIESLGTNTIRNASKASLKWEVADVISAIESRTHEFYCTDESGDLAKVIVALHLGRKYIKTEADSTRRDNLLAKRECKWSST